MFNKTSPIDVFEQHLPATAGTFIVHKKNLTTLAPITGHIVRFFTRKDYVVDCANRSLCNLISNPFVLKVIETREKFYRKKLFK